MTYIPPNGDIQFFDVDLSPNNENTFYFSTEQEKNSYFSNLQHITFSAQSYTRRSRGVVRVNGTMKQLAYMRYMRYRNVATVSDPIFDDKWYYAFITNVEYVNNACVEVYFIIDTLMTWMGAFSLGQCFIERQHSVTDNIGDNLIPENLDTGEYRIEKTESMDITGIKRASDLITRNYAICVATTVDLSDEEFENTEGNIYFGVYSGVSYAYFTSNQVSTLNDYLLKLTKAGKSDAIVSMSMIPSDFIDNNSSHALVRKTYYQYAPYDHVSGYSPKNKKLFTYPYKMLLVSNSEGEFAEYRYEFFGNKDANGRNQVAFEGFGMGTTSSECGIYPIRYKGFNGADGIGTQIISDPLSGMFITQFPQCTWNIDTFKAWFAQNRSSITTQLFSTLSNTIMSGALMVASLGSTSVPLSASTALSTNVIGGALQPVSMQQGVNSQGFVAGYTGTLAGIQSINGQLAKIHDYSRKPATAGGSIASDLTYSVGYKEFICQYKTITSEYAKIIDDYFTMYGYAQHSVGTPSMHCRSRFTYVKTIGCSVKGNMPASDAKEIEDRIDTGVRFWVDKTNFCKFTGNGTAFDNNILT